VAALAAEAAGLSPLVMVAPAANGAAYMGELLRRAMVRGASRGANGRVAGGRGGEAPSVKDLRGRLMADGLLDLNGFPLRREVLQEIEALALTSALRGLPGRSLVVQISRGGDPNASMAALADRLTELGGTSSLRVVRHEYAAAFGAPHFRPADQPIPTLEDVFAGIDEVIVGTILGWLEDEVPAAPKRPAKAPPVPNERTRPPHERSVGVREHPVFVPVGGEHLAAIVTVPDGEPRGLIALLQGGGGAPRSHQGAMWKIAARLAAERGLAAVRLDWRGVGDSTGRVTMELRHPAADDAGAVIGFAQRATGTEHLGLAGNCYGARTALGVARRLRPCSLAMVMLKPTAHMKRPVRRWERLRRLVKSSPILTGLALRSRSLIRRMLDRVRPHGPSEVFAQLSDVGREARVLVMEGEAERRDGRLRRAVASGRHGLGSVQVVDLPGDGVRAFDSLERQRFVVTELAEWFDRTMPRVGSAAEATPAGESSPAASVMTEGQDVHLPRSPTAHS
jgi:pimeloyl-ACP methyl ester carboxylesterase